MLDTVTPCCKNITEYEVLRSIFYMVRRIFYPPGTSILCVKRRPDYFLREYEYLYYLCTKYLKYGLLLQARLHRIIAACCVVQEHQYVLLGYDELACVCLYWWTRYWRLFRYINDPCVIYVITDREVERKSGAHRQFWDLCGGCCWIWQHTLLYTLPYSKSIHGLLSKTTVVPGGQIIKILKVVNLNSPLANNSYILRIHTGTSVPIKLEYAAASTRVTVWFTHSCGSARQPPLQLTIEYLVVVFYDDMVWCDMMWFYYTAFIPCLW